jgi:hypothetical protein
LNRSSKQSQAKLTMLDEHDAQRTRIPPHPKCYVATS